MLIYAIKKQTVYRKYTLILSHYIYNEIKRFVIKVIKALYNCSK